MVVSPIQTSFAGGERSPRVRGRVDTEVYRNGLAECRNFMPLPQGPLLMRAGSVYAGEEASAPRFFNFRLSDEAEDFILALTASKLRIYSRSGLVTALGPNLVTNPDFTAGLTGWTVVSNTVTANPPKAVLSYQVSPITQGRFRQGVPVLVGHSYRVSLRAYDQYNGLGKAHVRIGTTVGGAEVYEALNHTVTVDLLVVATATTLYIDVAFEQGFSSNSIAVVDPSVREDGAVVDVATPWAFEHLAGLQMVAEPAKDRVFFAHPNVAPRVLTYTEPATWALNAITFVSPPAEWTGTNWPGVVELFQGRLLLGATPAQPHDIWGSKTTNPYDFGVSATVVASDAFHYTLSTKGKMRWMQGRQVLLVGNETVESSAVGADQIITPVSPPDVRDESAFGSAAVQGVHTGDQVLFVVRDRRNVRALSYSNDENAWVSRAITFLAEHITAGLIRELHFARSPVPTVLLLLSNGEIVACTYDRGEQVAAWWRLPVGAGVHSIAVAEGPDGSELWLAPMRASGYLVEHIPLHEVGAVYVDSAKSGVVAADGTFGGLAHLEGETVRVIVAGAVRNDQVVAGGSVQAVTAQEIADDPTLVGAAVTVGLPYTARAVTLPFEGGNPRGTAQGAKRRFTRVGVILNDSALPLVDGKRVPDRTPATPQDEAEPRRTGAFAAAGALGWESEGVITIEQDLPVRTEVLALFGVAAVHER